MAGMERGEVHMGGWFGNFKKRELGRPRYSRMDNSKMDLQE